MAQQFMDDLNAKLNMLNQKMNDFSNFVVGKLQNFKTITLGEQISYVSVGTGFLLILISIVLFII
jgi:hypothetical protein